MQVVRHIVDRDEFLPLMGDDAGDVFLQFIVPVHRDEALASLHRKDGSGSRSAGRCWPFRGRISVSAGGEDAAPTGLNSFSNFLL